VLAPEPSGSYRYALKSGELALIECGGFATWPAPAPCYAVRAPATADPVVQADADD
jgi:hypothetical protein